MANKDGRFLSRLSKSVTSVPPVDTKNLPANETDTDSATLDRSAVLPERKFVLKQMQDKMDRLKKDARIGTFYEEKLDGKIVRH